MRLKHKNVINVNPISINLIIFNKIINVSFEYSSCSFEINQLALVLNAVLHVFLKTIFSK